MRSPASRLLRNEITENPWVWAAVVGCGALLLAATAAPPLASALALAPLDARSWALVGLTSLAPLALSQALLSLARRGS
jgi:Ca2+-transporting ATPase